MKVLATIAVCAMAVVAGAEEEYISPVTGKPASKEKYTLEQIKKRDEKVLQKTGGFIEQKASGPLTMIMDARAKATLTIDEVCRLYKLGTHLDVTMVKEPRGDKAALAFAQEKMQSAKPLMLVMVVENCAEYPALSVFPEERIGIVNADKLKEESKDPSAPETRVAKELWRAMGFIGGVGFSAQDNDMMQPYYTMKEMDANYHAYIQPMNMAKMQKFWQRWGVRKARRVPYKLAVSEGWAPMPTNEYQRAIWEQTHAVPKNPMQIKFDPKAGK